MIALKIKSKKKVIWFYSPVDPNKVNWQEEYKKNNDPNHASYTDRGVFIYTRNFNNIQGTFIQDLEKKLDFKIYYKPCEWISFINNNFIYELVLDCLANEVVIRERNPFTLFVVNLEV